MGSLCADGSKRNRLIENSRLLNKMLGTGIKSFAMANDSTCGDHPQHIKSWFFCGMKCIAELLLIIKYLLSVCIDKFEFSMDQLRIIFHPLLCGRSWQNCSYIQGSSGRAHNRC